MRFLSIGFLLLSFAATNAAATTISYSTNGFFQDDLGVSANLYHVPWGPDSDGGCDFDTGAFACGDVVNGQGFSSGQYDTANNGGSYQLNSFIFHMEDTPAHGTTHGTLQETLTFDSIPVTIVLSYTYFAGSSFDSFQFIGGDVATFVDGSTIFTLTTLATPVFSSGSDEAYRNGILSATIGSTTSIGHDDPAVPEPSAWTLFGSALAGAVFLARQGKANAATRRF